jgi:hypothetical protein
MTDPSRSVPLGPDPLRSSAATPARAQRARPADSPAFHVLLERLEARAAALEAQSRALDDPRLLAPAVEEARASLEDALSLGEGLLEAYRAARALEGDAGAPEAKP